MPPSAAIAFAEEEFTAVPTLFETAFIQTVLEHRGVFRKLMPADISAARDVLERYLLQCQDNPSNGALWMPDLDAESMASLKAKTFLMFGVTKPSPAQWHKAHTALFGPLLCETCG